MCWVLNPSLLIYTHILEPEALLIGLEVALLLLVALALARDRPPLWGRCLVIAVVGALATLIRPTLLPAGVAASLALMLRFKGQPRSSARLAIVGVLLVAALGLTIRNGLVAGSWSPTVMNPGTVLYEGNNPTSWGSSAAYPPGVYELGAAGESDVAHQSYRMLARLSTGDDRLSVGGVNSFWISKSAAFTADHPGRAVRLLGVKLDAIARSEREHDLSPAEALDRWLRQHWIVGVPISIVVFPAIYGLGLAVRSWRQHLVLLVIVATQVASMVILYPSARQRLTLLPCLVVLAALAFQQLARQRRRGILVGALLVALGLAWLPATDRQADRRHHRGGLAQGRTLLTQAQQARDAGDLARAVELSTRAYVVAPDLLERSRLADISMNEQRIRASAEELSLGGPSERFDAARLLSLLGDSLAALDRLEDLQDEHLVRAAVRSSRPEVHAARLLVRDGQRQEARVLLDSALERAPGEPFALALRSVLAKSPSADSGRSGGSVGSDERALRRYVDDLSADLLLADAERLVGARRASARRLEPWLERLSSVGEEARRVRMMHVAAVAGFDPERAAGLYLELMRLGSEPVLFEDEVVEVFAMSARREPVDPDAQWLYLRILRQYGRLADASRHLRELPEEVVADPRVQQESRLLRAPGSL